MNNESYDWFAAQMEATDDTETSTPPNPRRAERRDGSVARDNEAFRRDFPRVLEGGDTLGEVLDSNLDLEAPADDFYVVAKYGVVSISRR